LEVYFGSDKNSVFTSRKKAMAGVYKSLQIKSFNKEDFFLN